MLSIEKTFRASFSFRVAMRRRHNPCRPPRPAWALWINASVWQISVTSAVARRKRSGLPKASTAACIFVVSPPRERPMAYGPFFCAPAACWWARTMVESINSASRSGSLANSSTMRAHTPFLLQRDNRLYTLCQLPNGLGRSRHGEPVRTIHSTTSTN